jgi:hypothetical protein
MGQFLDSYYILIKKQKLILPYFVWKEKVFYFLYFNCLLVKIEGIVKL